MSNIWGSCPILSKDAKGENNFAEEAKDSSEYYKGLKDYDKKLRELTQPIWEKEYKEKRC